MPIFRRTRPCVTACGVLRWFCWVWLVAVVGRCVVGCEHCEDYCSTLVGCEQCEGYCSTLVGCEQCEGYCSTCVYNIAEQPTIHTPIRTQYMQPHHHHINHTPMYFNGLF